MALAMRYKLHSSNHIGYGLKALEREIATQSTSGKSMILKREGWPRSRCGAHGGQLGAKLPVKRGSWDAVPRIQIVLII